MGWLVNEKGIEPHIPVFDKGERGDDGLSRGEFAYDGLADSYTCPAGKPLQQCWTASRAAKASRPRTTSTGTMSASKIAVRVP